MLVLLVLGSGANVVNYVSSLVFSRLLEPVGFGELTSLLALSVVLAVPLGAAQTIVAERVSMAYAEGDTGRVRWLVRYALGHVAVLGLVMTGVYVLCIPALLELLDIREPGPAVALAPLILITFLNPVTFGVLQGVERFALLGGLILVTATSRLIFGVPWVLAGGGAGGAIAGQALGLIVVNALVLWRFRAWVVPRGGRVAREGMRRKVNLYALSASGAFVGFALLSNIDLVLARVFLDSEEAGIYAAIATVAKVIIFVPSAIATIMVPRAAKQRASTGSGIRALRMSALAVMAVTLAISIPAVVAPGLVVQIMFGSDYDAATDGVLPAVVAGTGLALLYLLATYSVTVRDRRWVFLLIGGVLLQVAAIAMFHESAVQLAWAQAAVVLTVLAVNEALFHSVLRPHPS